VALPRSGREPQGHRGERGPCDPRGEAVAGPRSLNVEIKQQGRILIRQKVSQSDLAAMAGIARENVSRALNDWANRSLVSRLAGYYCLENKTALNREAEG
jgi:hypothetical protein